MPGLVDQLELRAGNARAVGAPVVRRHDAVARAPEQQRRHPDAVQPAGELGVVHGSHLGGAPRRLGTPIALIDQAGGHGRSLPRGE